MRSWSTELVAQGSQSDVQCSSKAADCESSPVPARKNPDKDATDRRQPSLIGPGPPGMTSGTAARAERGVVY